LPVTERAPGWSWFEYGSNPTDNAPDMELCRAYARCFAGQDGQQVRAHLARTILDRRLPPTASDAELRHLEGQRCAIAGLVAMIERGRG
jgi:hypothetical protein